MWGEEGDLLCWGVAYACCLRCSVAAAYTIPQSSSSSSPPLLLLLWRHWRIQDPQVEWALKVVVRSGRGILPPHRGKRLCPLPKKIFRFFVKWCVWVHVGIDLSKISRTLDGCHSWSPKGGGTCPNVPLSPYGSRQCLALFLHSVFRTS